MDLLHARCAGLDVHKDLIVGCIRVQEGRQATTTLMRFGATTRELLKLSEWLHAAGCTHVAMEATGVYWKPVWHILEDSFALVLANAGHIKGVPGRKSDVNDAAWIADLLAHGLIRGSMVPPQPVQEIRELTRERLGFVREVTRHTQRVQKVLEDCNVKLSSVLSDTMGLTGRKILRAIVKGQKDPERLADLAHGGVKASREELVESLRGRYTPHNRFLLEQHLKAIEDSEKIISVIERRIGKAIEPFRDAIERLSTIPGVSKTAAASIVGEIGVDMGRFETDDHLVSWACLCPRMEESAGKRRSTRIRKGANYLKPLLLQGAWAAIRTKGSYLRAKYYRLKSRRGSKKAAIAIAASILRAVYIVLRDGVNYRELGADYFIPKDRLKVAKRLAARIQELGFNVQLQAVA
ncbi:MAG TPA: IS110 family transposase [Polyangiaceae bacterium]|nr:IS110 family transposase [Polyangiaceae bacterium]